MALDYQSIKVFLLLKVYLQKMDKSIGTIVTIVI